MVKKFYLGLLSLRYGHVLVGAAFGVFLSAFLYERNRINEYRIILIILTIILAILMFFYYKNKMTIYRIIKKISNIEEYEKGGMLEKSFILEDRMLVANGLHIEEHSTNSIQTAYYESKGRRGILHIESDEGTYAVACIDEDEAQRFVAFLKRKNPKIILQNINPKGEGTLKELGKA